MGMSASGDKADSPDSVWVQAFDRLRGSPVVVGKPNFDQTKRSGAVSACRAPCQRDRATCLSTHRRDSLRTLRAGVPDRVFALDNFPRIANRTHRDYDPWPSSAAFIPDNRS